MPGLSLSADACVVVCVGVCHVAGVPPILAAMTLTFSINLFGSITHYASGQAAIFYGSGFMSLPEVGMSSMQL